MIQRLVFLISHHLRSECFPISFLAHMTVDSQFGTIWSWNCYLNPTHFKFYLLNVAVSVRKWQHFVALSIKELAHFGIVIAQYRLLLIPCNPLHCCLGLEDYLLWTLLEHLWLFKNSNFPQRWCKDVSQSTFKMYRVKKNVVVWVVSVINRLSSTDASLENFHYW